MDNNEVDPLARLKQAMAANNAKQFNLYADPIRNDPNSAQRSFEWRGRNKERVRAYRTTVLYKESRREYMRKAYAADPDKYKGYVRRWNDKHQEWVDNFKEKRLGTSRVGPFISIDSEGQNYPVCDPPERDIIYDGVLYAPHGTYVWGASPIEPGKAVYLADPRTQGVVKYKLGVTAVFDWLLDVVKPQYGDANYVMFGMSYDMTQLLAQLPRETAYEIFKSKRFEDDEEVRAPVFWRDYAIKLVKSKWLILWRLRDPDHPYMVDENGENILTKKGQMQLDASQKIQIYETFGYFQTGFAKVVDDMLDEERARVAKRLSELKTREEYTLSAAYETELKATLKDKPLGWYVNKIGERIDVTLADRLRGAREYGLTQIQDERASLGDSERTLAADTAIINKMKKLRGEFENIEIEPIKEYMTAEIRLLSKRMEQVRSALAELGLYPSSWHGPGAVASALIDKYKIRDHFGEYISAESVSPQQDFAHHSFAGGRIESLKQGYLATTYLSSYDLASAYPAGAVELPSLAPHTGEWVHKTKDDYNFTSLSELRTKVEAASMVSMFRLKWLLPSFARLGKEGKADPKSEFVPFFPLWFRKPTGGILCPSSGYGTYNREDVLAAISFMERYMPKYPKSKYSALTFDGADTLFVIEEAWVWDIKQGCDGIRPFAILKELYARRCAIKDEIDLKNKAIKKHNDQLTEGALPLPYEYNILEKVIKLVLNSIYGKQAQFVGSEGKVPKCANPYYAAAITAYCRRRVLEAALLNPSAIVFFATDGIVATRALHTLPDIKENNGHGVHKDRKSLDRVKDKELGATINLGDWEYARRDGGIFVMSGVYAHYLYEKDKGGNILLDGQGYPKLKLVGKLRGADVTKYKQGETGQPWLVENTLKAWREPFDINDVASLPSITTAYKKFVTAGSVLTPRITRSPKGEIVESNTIAADERYKRAGRWAPKTDDPRNLKIIRENADIRKANEKLWENAKISPRTGRLQKPKGLIEETPEIVFSRTIHVHDIGIKRRHIAARPWGYQSLEGYEAQRCTDLIETVPTSNLVKDETGTLVRNWELSFPRLPKWLNKNDEARVEDAEDREEVALSTLCYDGEEFNTPMDEHEGE